MIIRPERVGDYPAIADVNARAFDNRATEPVIVSLLRHRRDFDPDLSLVAEIDGRIVGHALFSPYTMRLLDADVRAVNLAPIGVLPSHQGRGIGAALIEEGHRIAREKGFSLSFLLGHSSYYPRFGYRTHAYGSAEVAVPADTLPAPVLAERSVTADDTPALRALWRHDEGNVDFELDPGPDLLDWVSPNPAIESIVYERAGELAGYTRLSREDPARPRVFLASDEDAARLVAAGIARRAQAAEIALPIHPRSRSAGAFQAPGARAWEAAMAMALGPSPLDEYFVLVEAARRPVGRVIWPVAFDL